MMDLFPPEEPAAKAELRTLAQQLAAGNVMIGTSSWKYPGWSGQLYTPERYAFRDKFAKSRFEEHCLEEYAEVFPTVCADAGFYRFPPPQQVRKWASQTPDGFKMSWKVTDEITAKKFANLPRHGERAGQPNKNFLNAELFVDEFLGPLSEHRGKVGALIFEFGHLYKTDIEHGRDFVAVLDGFLERLPRDWQYAVEIRNKGFLQPEYFAALTTHGVAHVFNSWTRMPPVVEQLALENSYTTNFTVGRFLLEPGRKYEEAVEQFSPYDRTKEVYEEGRDGLRSLVQKAKERSERTSYIYVNNRLEGNALKTITEALSMLSGD